MLRKKKRPPPKTIKILIDEGVAEQRVTWEEYCYLMERAVDYATLGLSLAVTPVEVDGPFIERCWGMYAAQLTMEYLVQQRKEW